MLAVWEELQQCLFGGVFGVPTEEVREMRRVPLRASRRLSDFLEAVEVGGVTAICA